MHRELKHEHPQWWGMGGVEVICGPMFSGKTEELIRRLRRAVIAKQRVLVFKPRIDNRYDAESIVSHSDHRFESIAVADVSEMRDRLNPEADIVGVDEAQFFGLDLVPFVEAMAHSGKRVVVAGLDQDYLGKPFGPMPDLLAIADSVTKQYAVCMSCGAPATKSQRIFNKVDDARVLIGGQGVYEARCRRCYKTES